MTQNPQTLPEPCHYSDSKEYITNITAVCTRDNRTKDNYILVELENNFFLPILYS